MSWHEVVFERGTCHIHVTESVSPFGAPVFVARMFLVSDDGASQTDIRGNAGSAEVHAPSEALAISSAVSFLQGKLGALAEYAHGI